MILSINTHTQNDFIYKHTYTHKYPYLGKPTHPYATYPRTHTHYHIRGNPRASGQKHDITHANVGGWYAVQFACFFVYFIKISVFSIDIMLCSFVERERKTERECVCVYVHVCMRACVCLCVRARICTYVCTGGYAYLWQCLWLCVFLKQKVTTKNLSATSQ